MNSIERETETVRIAIDLKDEGVTWTEVYNEFISSLKGLGYISKDFDNMRIED